MTYEYVLPANWACPIINDDWSGLEEEETDALDHFLTSLKEGEWITGCEDETYFAGWHDAWWCYPLGGDVRVFTSSIQE